LGERELGNVLLAQPIPLAWAALPAFYIKAMAIDQLKYALLHRLW